MPEDPKDKAALPGEEKAPEDKKKADGPLKETLYDKIPLTYRQVDIFVKVMIGIIVVLLVVGIFTGSRA